MKSTFATLLGVITLSSLLSAQVSIQGQWSGELQTDGGAQPVQMAITAAEDYISGSIIAGGQELSISEAVLSAGVVEFSTNELRNGQELKFRWTGLISSDGNEIKFSCVVDGTTGPAQDIVVRRQAN